jgi:hypothetical protein
MRLGSWWESQKERDHWGGRENNFKMDLREMGWGGMDWIDLAHDRDQWRALLNTIVNLPVQ